MTYLFHLLQPREKLRITRQAIAKMLNIPLNLIIRVECWTHVIFIHRQDRGGQFISYRKLREWQNAVASDRLLRPKRTEPAVTVGQIQKCQNLSQLNSLWIAIELDLHRYQTQYTDNYLEFIQRIWSDRRSQLNQKSKISLAANY